MWTALVSSSLRATFVSTDKLPGLDRIDPAPAVATLLAQAPWVMWLGAVGSALAWQLLPLLTIGWPLPASLLPAKARDRHTQAMATHRIYLVRMSMTMIKTVGGLVWGAHPQVRAALTMPVYPPDPGTWRDEKFAAR